MTNLSRLAVAAAALAVGIASPAIAQSHYKTAVHRGGHSKVVTIHRGGRHAFALVPAGRPGVDASAPALAGGGSAGYNSSLRDDI